LARTPRKWQGARTPSGLKRVRQAERRHAILQPRRSAAKTLVAKAVTVAETQPESTDVGTTLAEAISALDRAAKSGAIHANAAARRKSRLTRKVNAAVGGTAVVGGHVAKSTSKAAATKAAKARIAAGKASKARVRRPPPARLAQRSPARRGRSRPPRPRRSSRPHRPRQPRRRPRPRRPRPRLQPRPPRRRRRRRRPPRPLPRRPHRRPRRRRRPSSPRPSNHRRPGHRPGRFDSWRVRRHDLRPRPAPHSQPNCPRRARCTRSVARRAPILPSRVLGSGFRCLTVSRSGSWPP